MDLFILICVNVVSFTCHSHSSAQRLSKFPGAKIQESSEVAIRQCRLTLSHGSKSTAGSYLNCCFVKCLEYGLEPQSR